MDLRVRKTERAIRQAFFQLVQTKPIEKITVKELSELAEINKSTFYAHYETIYDLLETVEQEAIDAIVAHLDSLHLLIDDPRRFVYHMYQLLCDVRANMIRMHTSGHNFFQKLICAIAVRAEKEGIHPEEYSHMGILLEFLISGLLSIQKNSPSGAFRENLSEEELEYLAVFVEGGIRALPSDLKNFPAAEKYALPGPDHKS